MQRIDWIAVRLAALSAVSFAIGACSSDLSLTLLRKSDWASFSGAKNEFALRRVTSEDLVGAEGQCPFAGAAQTPGAADAAPGAPATAALVQGGVALQMAESAVRSTSCGARALLKRSTSAPMSAAIARWF